MSTTQLINPATEEVLASVDHTDANAVDDAVQRARAAQRRWARLAPAQRAAGLRAFAAAVQAHLDELAALEVANSGHPIVSAEWEAGHVRDVLAFYAASPERLSGRQIPVAGGVDVTFNEPMGVVGVITPWNFPMVIASWAIAPALAAGNAVLVKPAELTPLTTMRLGELAVEAGLDEDLLQVLPGKGTVVGERFVTHPDIRKIVFTGSTEVGKRVMAGAAAQVKRVTLELGGKSANIVFHDCDLERAATTAPAGVFDNAGQDCCARSRILVQRAFTTGLWSCSSRRYTALSSGTPDHAPPRWVRWYRAHTVTRSPVMCPTTLRWRFGVRLRLGADFGFHQPFSHPNAATAPSPTKSSGRWL